MDMTERQLFRARRLIRRECANYDEGFCLPLDRGDGVVCPQSISYSLVCRYFLYVVLPLDPELCYALKENKSGMRRCRRCGMPFLPGSNAAKYCRECAKIIRRARQAEDCRRRRAKRRKP